MSEIQEIPYFVKDFLHVLETVQMHYGAEFSTAEKQFCAKLMRLSPQALCLFIRLMNRSKDFYSRAKINYQECEPLNEAVEELLECGLALAVLSNHEDICAIMRDCYTVKEFDLLKSAAQTKPKTKGEYILRLETSKERNWWIDQLLSANPIIAPVRDPWRFFAYLYFGELTPNLSAFVIKELGHLTPEKVEPARYEPAFASRLHGEIKYQHDQCYEEFRKLRGEMTALELYHWWKEQRLPSPIDNSTSKSHDHMVCKMGQLLTKAQCFDLAIATYKQCISYECALPLAKLLRKRGDKDEALKICREHLLNSADPEIVHQGNILMQRLAGKQARSEAHVALHSHYIAAVCAGPHSVEQAALQHLREQGWEGIHSENWLWCALFGVVLWPVIYDPAFGSFNHSCQLAPTDLWSPEFFTKRSKEIESRIKNFTSKEVLLFLIRTTLAAKKEVTNPFFRWQPDLEIYLAHLCHYLPLSGLKAVLKRMATDPGKFLKGFPDLFIWKEPTEYNLVEVKSVNDKLSAHQLAWINTFISFGIKTEVMRVRLS